MGTFDADDRLSSQVNGTSNLRVLVEDCSATKNSVKSEGGGFRFSVSY